jgi:hypothetical protein
MHLVGFIINKFVTIHGHRNVKLVPHIVNGAVITRGYVVTLLHDNKTIRHERCCVAE